MTAPNTERSFTPAPPVCESHYCPRGYETDQNQRLKPETLFQFIMDTATNAARTTGGAPQHLHETGLGWFLIRFHLKLGRYPRRGEEITLQTWLHRMKGVTSVREFKLLGSDGAELGGATTQWAMVDMKRRAATRLPEWYSALFPTLAERQIDDPFRKMETIESGSLEHNFHVRLSDLDGNRHATSASYADWFLETVPEQVHEQLLPIELEIHYKNELNYRDQLRVVSDERQDERSDEKANASEDASGSSYVHAIYRNAEESPAALARSRWGKETISA